MNTFTITIDGAPVAVTSGQSVLDAARAAGIDIPSLCYLEKCGTLNSCQVCLVKINEKLVPSCGTRVAPGMTVESESEEVHEARRTALELLFSDHVGDCLSPCNRLCPLGLNIPLMLRQVEAGKLAEASATLRNTMPLAGILGRLCHHPCEQGCRRGHWDDPAGIRDLERFVSDWDSGRLPSKEASAAQETPAASDLSLPVKPPSGRSVAVIGSGPTGLAAAWYLARHGHHVTVVDKHEVAGGSLRQLPETDLPVAVLGAELARLSSAGVELKLAVALGKDVTLEGLSRGFDAILICTGKPELHEVESMGLPALGAFVKADPNGMRTPLAKVFAAGAAVKPLTQVVRAMGEGRAAAECVHRFLTGQIIRRPEKPFSSVMGRLSPGELKQVLASANPVKGVSPCDRCSSMTRPQAATEASRCLHCDCHSSGNCVLQHYAQVYNADASRFRAQRREFEQYTRPGGVIFEPGKCILCGICVKLTEMAREPLGLAFVGRGFEVRVACPFDESIQEGLQKTAEECVKHCPTGALAFDDKPKSEFGLPGMGLPQVTAT